jgi:gas vesicle protein
MTSRTVGNWSNGSLIGLAVGVAAGVAAGLLMAPMRGRELRQTLRDRAADGSARLQSLASQGRTWCEQAIDRSQELLEIGRRAFEESRSASATSGMRPAMSEVASRHHGMRGGIHGETL